jgi:hypothetical protein
MSKKIKTMTLERAVRQPDGSQQQTAYFEAAKGWDIEDEGGRIRVCKAGHAHGIWVPVNRVLFVEESPATATTPLAKVK